jgi:hypothetical protein
LPSAAKIYLLFIGWRAYYCGRGYLDNSGELLGFLLALARLSTWSKFTLIGADVFANFIGSKEHRTGLPQPSRS